MGYKATLDGVVFFDTTVDDHEYSLTSAKLTLTAGSAGSFVFTIPTDNTAYGNFNRLISYVDVYRNDTKIFSGRVYGIDKAFNLSEVITCEGLLAVLSDSIFRPITHDGGLISLVTKIINSHNEQVESRKQLRLGRITVADSTCYRAFENYETSISRLKDLCTTFGGYMQVRYESGILFFDWLADYYQHSNQTIRLKENLLDFTQSEDSKSIATVIIPLGAKQEDGSRVSIASVNGGNDYIYADQKYIDAYGYVWATETWDNVNEPMTLMTKAKKFAQTACDSQKTFTVKAVDLADAGYEVTDFAIGQRIPVISDPHGLYENECTVVGQAVVGQAVVGKGKPYWFAVLNQNLDLLNPASNTMTLGMAQRGYVQTMSRQRNDIKTLMESMSTVYPTKSVMAGAVATATALITGNMGGYIVQYDGDGDGYPDEFLIMDNLDKDQASSVWRFNKNGLGYSSTGYNGLYGLAMTMNGEIVADYITTGTMLFDRCRGGTLQLGGVNDRSGVLEVLDASGNVIGSWTKNGIYASKGTFQGDLIATSLTLIDTSIAASSISGLAAVATTGNASDVSGLASVATTGQAADILGLANVATSGSASDVSGLANVATSGLADDITGLAAVATSGAYSDLSGKPDLTVYLTKTGAISRGTVGDGSVGFSLSVAGLLQCSNAVVYGTIYASAGLIGGWIAAANRLYSRNAMTEGTAGTQYHAGMNGYGMNSSATADVFQVAYRTYDGSDFGSWVYPFRVKYNGAVTMTDATVTGDVTTIVSTGYTTNGIVTSKIGAFTFTDLSGKYNNIVSSQSMIGFRSYGSNNTYNGDVCLIPQSQTAQGSSGTYYTHAGLIARNPLIIIGGANGSIGRCALALGSSGSASASLTGATVAGTGYSLNLTGTTMTVIYENGSSSQTILSAQGAISATSCTATFAGYLTCTAGKSRLVKTKDYGERLLYCYEMPSPMFGDIGEGQLDEDGICYVDIDDIFFETSRTDLSYQVFLQKEGQGDVYVSEKTGSYFVVEGTPRLSFAWEVKCKQLGFEAERLDEITQRDMALNNSENYFDIEGEYSTEADDLLIGTESQYEDEYDELASSDETLEEMEVLLYEAA